MTQRNGLRIIALALLVVLLAAAAVAGGSWKWGGTQREAGWTWNSVSVRGDSDFEPVGDDSTFTRDGWTWGSFDG